MKSPSGAPAATSPSPPGLQPGFVPSSSCGLGWPRSSFLSLFHSVILFIVSALSLGSEGILLNGLSALETAVQSIHAVYFFP